jgi:hypothetical protein
MAGLLVLPWYQDQNRRVAKSVKARIAQESATRASSERVGLRSSVMLHPCVTAPSGPEPVGS